VETHLHNGSGEIVNHNRSAACVATANGLSARSSGAEAADGIHSLGGARMVGHAIVLDVPPHGRSEQT